MEGRALRSAACETAATTAGTLRGASLSLHHDTHVTTPSTGERHLSTHTASVSHVWREITDGKAAADVYVLSIHIELIPL